MGNLERILPDQVRPSEAKLELGRRRNFLFAQRHKDSKVVSLLEVFPAEAQ